VLTVVRRVCIWAVAHDILETDPTTGVLKPLKIKPSRDRVLDDAEIVSFWTGCDQLGWPFGPLFKLLLLTAQRRSEVAGMRWSELDLEGKLWHIPGERIKNSKAHDVHLSDFALEIIHGLVELKPAAGKPDFVFSFTGDAAVSGFVYTKRTLDNLIGVHGWRLHDLRRTATTGMARLGIPPHVADRVLNHTTGTIHGVAAVYNRFQYLDERKAALDAWARFVEALVRPETAQTNVVGLRR
jgi:integrase